MNHNFDRQTIFNAVIFNLQAQLAISLEAADSAHSQATHSECIAQSRYDTLGLEQAYLAEGQSVRAAQLRLDISQLKDLQCKSLSAKQRSEEIQVTSLVVLTTQETGTTQPLHVFILPISGGTSIQIQHTTIRVLSVNSPLGQALLGKEQQERVSINHTQYQILNVF